MDWQQLFQEDWPIAFYIVSQLIFVIFLCVCLWTGVLRCDGGSKRTLSSSSGRSQRDIKMLVREILQPKVDALKKLVTVYEISRLHDGMLEFSTMTLQAEEQLFDEIKSARNELSGLQLDQSVEVKRFFKTKFMKHPFDLPGARRLQSILKQYKNCQVEYNRGFSSCGGFFCFVSSISSCVWGNIPPVLPLDSNKQPGIFTKCKAVLSFIFLPILVIAADMFYSDTMVFYGLITFIGYYKPDMISSNPANNITTNSTTLCYTNTYISNFTIDDTDQNICRVVIGMDFLLLTIYSLSLTGILLPRTWSSLWTSYKTGIFMSDVSVENSLTKFPIGSVTRFNLSLDESTSESSMQNAVQWSIYFQIQYVVGRILLSSNVMIENESFRFNTLLVSGFTSMVSLTLGQMKANKLLTQYQTTGAQQIVYGLACLASTISSQMLLTVFLVTIADVWMIISIRFGAITEFTVPFLVFPLALIVSGIRMFLIQYEFGRGGALKTKKDSFIINVMGLYSACFSVQPLHLQTSKTRVTGISGITYYLGPDSQEWLFRENLVAHIFISLISMCLFTISQIWYFIQNEFLPFSSTISGAKRNILIIASIFIPLGWIVAQGLVRLFLHMDLGGLTCGAIFKFEEENADDLTSRPEDNLHQSMELEGNLKKAWWKRIGSWFTRQADFEYETGRWVEDNNGDETYSVRPFGVRCLFCKILLPGDETEEVLSTRL